MIPLGLVLRLAPYAAVAAVSVSAYHFAPFIGPHARLERLEAKRAGWEASSVKWKAATEGWKASFAKSEAIRKRESAAAVESINAYQDQCSARVKAARASAKAIRNLVDEPVKTDTSGCPVRDIIGADRLRDVLGTGANR